jgi:hypothetical protein
MQKILMEIAANTKKDLLNPNIVKADIHRIATSDGK